MSLAVPVDISSNDFMGRLSERLVCNRDSMCSHMGITHSPTYLHVNSVAVILESHCLRALLSVTMYSM